MQLRLRDGFVVVACFAVAAWFAIDPNFGWFVGLTWLAACLGIYGVLAEQRPMIAAALVMLAASYLALYLFVVWFAW